MNFKHPEHIGSEAVYFESFKKTSFIEKTARWARRFCYGFILITAAAMVIEFISPFGRNVPDLFMQLLFLLLFWGTIELLTIPLEYINDNCVVDFEKNWIALCSQRFFYRRTTVMATFNQIKAIGVSARPPGITKAVFSASENRYAIFMQTLNNQLIQISDYSLDLDDANAFCHRLYASHFSGAAYIGGAPGMEIFVDPVSGETSTRPAKRSSLSLVDAASLPAFQAVLAFLITFAILSISISSLEKLSKDAFDTDLNVARQPVFQLLAGVEKLPPDSIADEAMEKPKIADTLQTIPLPFPGNTAASAPVKIDMAKQQIVQLPKISAVEGTISPVPDTQIALDSAIVAKASSTMVTTLPTKLEEPVTPAAEEPHEKNPEAETEISKPVISELETSQPILLPDEAPRPKPQPIKRINAYPVARIDTPIPSRIPSINVENLPPGKTFKVVHAKRPGAKPYVQKKTLKDKPLLAAAPQKSPAKKPTLLPGYGIFPLFSLDDSFATALKNIGKPLTKFHSTFGWQIVFSGFTIITDDRKENKISRVIITRANSQSHGSLITPQGISVGSLISEVKNKYGPHTVLAGAPGLHYKSLGISFIPSNGDQKKVGAIQIYQPVSGKN